MAQGLLGAESSVVGLERTARELLEKNELDRAIATLESYEDPSGVREALLGAAYFRKEEYARAAEWLRSAQAKGQGSSELQGLLTRSEANDVAEVKRPVPEPVAFTRAVLMQGPRPGEGSRKRLLPRAQTGWVAGAFEAIGKVAGREFGRAIGVATKLFRESAADGPANRIWTTWYDHGLARATLMLASRRERLNREQLFNAYAPGDRVGFCSAAQAPEWVKAARTADGSWNDPKEPLAGAANVRFGFNTDPSLTRGETEADRLLTPNPRLVSRVLLTRGERMKPVPFLNLSAASWIQFMTHDWVSYGDPMPANLAPPYAIPLDPSDPARRLLHQTHMLVRRTQSDPTRTERDARDTHINEVTSWWDGSQLYGSDPATVRAVRSMSGGKLALDANGRLPVAADGVERTGFRRNWWLGLSMLHTLFTYEHNAICDQLAARYPRWDDQRLFDVARLVNAAVMAKLHTVEWTPAILPNRVLHAAMNANWYGFLTNLLRAKNARRTVAKINIADPIAGGIVGNATNDHGVPYSLTREFLSVYRLHSLLPDAVDFYRVGDKSPEKTLPLAALRQAASSVASRDYSMADLFYSFGRQNPGALVLNNFPETLQNLSIPGAGFYDLAAVDVLRDRERGVPRYNQFRRLLGLRPILKFDDLTDDHETVKLLMSVYSSVEDIDLLVGNLAEGHRPDKFGFGETLFEIFILNASRRLEADRFFTDDYNEQVYTPEGIEWVDQVTYKSVLLRHMPALRATGLANVDNAFEPWDTGKLDPSRHPLRAYDSELEARDEGYAAV